MPANTQTVAMPRGMNSRMEVVAGIVASQCYGLKTMADAVHQTEIDSDQTKPDMHPYRQPKGGSYPSIIRLHRRITGRSRKCHAGNPKRSRRHLAAFGSRRLIPGDRPWKSINRAKWTRRLSASPLLTV